MLIITFFGVIHHFFCAMCDHVRLRELEKPVLNIKIEIGHLLKLLVYHWSHGDHILWTQFLTFFLDISQTWLTSSVISWYWCCHQLLCHSWRLQIRVLLSSLKLAACMQLCKPYQLDRRRRKLHHQGVLVKHQRKSSSCKRRKAYHWVLVKHQYTSGIWTRRKTHHQGVLVKCQYKSGSCKRRTAHQQGVLVKCWYKSATWCHSWYVSKSNEALYWWNVVKLLAWGCNNLGALLGALIPAMYSIGLDILLWVLAQMM